VSAETEQEHFMSSKVMASQTPAKWATPTLTHRGSVGQILKSGGGKLSITGQDPGEMRCEKPHVSECNAASGS
jgi:hypothetical protein